MNISRESRLQGEDGLSSEFKRVEEVASQSSAVIHAQQQKRCAAVQEDDERVFGQNNM
jgi:hypothetical protein